MDYAGKHILIVGMARSGIAAAKELSRLGALVTINDNKELVSLGPAIDELHGLNLTFQLGQNAAPLIPGMDLVVISPGVPIDSAVVQEAHTFGIPVLGELEVAFTLCQAPVIAVTGTNGKTTTTALMGLIMQNAGYQTHVVGNIGVPFLSVALQTRPQDVVVLEVSSFQLESVQTLKPRVASILNLTEDHLNRHHTMEIYAATKARLIARMDQSDTAVLNYDDAAVRVMAANAGCDIAWFSRMTEVAHGAFMRGRDIWHRDRKGTERMIASRDALRIPGEHNLEDALAAVAMAMAYGVEPSVIELALREFPGVEHRLEFVREVRTVRFINDSKATNPDSTIKAIEAMARPTVLLLGGYDKGSDFTALFGCIMNHRDNIVDVVAYGQTGEQILQCANAAGYRHIEQVDSFIEAVRLAAERAPEHGNVLLSPACASFDMFTDFEERGRMFKQIVNQWA